MTKFKNFFYKSLLVESPKTTGDFDTPYSDIEIAKQLFSDIEKNSRDYKKVFSIFHRYKIDLYLNVDGDDHTLYFIPTNGDDFIYGYNSYEMKNDGGIEMISVYNRPLYFGLAQYVYIEYLIPKYQYIMSNGFHSLSGKKFWKNLVNFSISKKYSVNIWDDDIKKIIKNITNVEELESYYDNNVDFEKYRIIIKGE